MTEPQGEDTARSADPAGADAGPPRPGAGFGASAGEMANETEVEVDPAAPVDEPVDEQAAAPVDEVAVQLQERTDDLQRLQAEFRNYKRRVERDRELIKENARFAVLTPIIEVLDTIDRAREHGELEGGFKAVADQLERVIANLGLTRFGEPGDVFDPTLHDALSHVGTDPEVTETTCRHIAKAGYRIGDRVVRAAQVLVVDPE